MPLIDAIAGQQAELTRWRRDLYANPELGFKEQRTADFVAAKLREFGLDVHEGIGGTGVVGVLPVGNDAVRCAAGRHGCAVHRGENVFDHRSRHEAWECRRVVRNPAFS